MCISNWKLLSTLDVDGENKTILNQYLFLHKKQEQFVFKIYRKMEEENTI